MNLDRYLHLIWDWNGTLLNDAWLCVEVMNGMLSKRHLPALTLERYREMFMFPVRDYYLNLGFDFREEPFELVGMEFMILYNRRQHECGLHPEVNQLLSYCQRKGFLQSILSAREQKELLAETVNLGVRPFFQKVYGLDDHYAHGKTEVGFRLIRDLDLPPDKLVFIGDTLHDAEVAREIGIDCILIPDGHNSEARIRTSEFPVVDTLSAFIKMIE
jgi:phosphoglycolate phosphatase